MSGSVDDARLGLHHAEPHLGAFKQGIGYRHNQKRYQKGQLCPIISIINCNAVFLSGPRPILRLLYLYNWHAIIRVLCFLYPKDSSYKSIILPSTKSWFLSKKNFILTLYLY
jgi:hypothetical protein